MTRRSRTVAVVASLVLFVAATIVWLRAAPRVTPEGQPPLLRLDPASVQTLRDAFNVHADEPRLLVLLSPT